MNHRSGIEGYDCNTKQIKIKIQFILIQSKLSIIFIELSSLGNSKSICCANKTEGFDHGFYFPDIIREYSVLIGELNLLPYKIMCIFQNRTAPERPAEFYRLAGCQQLYGQYIFKIFQYHFQFTAADTSHTYMILLSQGRGDAIGASGKQSVLFS